MKTSLKESVNILQYIELLAALTLYQSGNIFMVKCPKYCICMVKKVLNPMGDVLSNMLRR